MKSVMFNRRRGFTLIELLVVVAIIALLISILLPSLAKAREQGKRAVCLANLHHQGIGYASYAQDFKQVLPVRGGFPYDIKEPENYLWGTGRKDVRTVVNAGGLYGKYAGKNLKFFYCPNNQMFSMSDPNNGMVTFHYDTSPPAPPGFRLGVTWGGYLYAAPVPPGCYPKDDGRGWVPPGSNRTSCIIPPGMGLNMETGTRNGWKAGDPYGSVYAYSTVMKLMRLNKGLTPYQGRLQALASDSYIGKSAHKKGYVVLFLDYHARWVSDPDDQVVKNGASSGQGGVEGLLTSWNLLSQKY